MMNDEFKKLDQLMERNVPSMSKTISQRQLTAPKTRGWMSYGLSLGLCSVLAFFVLQHNQQLTIESSEAIEEILTWDVTADEFSEDYEVTLAMLD
jgi:hypothetical protein